jgi:hypothetical protein
MAEAMGEQDLTTTAAWLLSARRAESGRLMLIHDWVKNRAQDIYVPESATAEYRKLVDQARFNILPLLISSLAQNLFVDGYRPAGRSDNAEVWQVWQANRMDARQSGIYRAALKFGYAYASVLPASVDAEDDGPVITPWSPRRMTALYSDPINDEWPEYAVSVGIPRPVLDATTPTRMVTDVTIYDDTHTYTFEVPAEVVQPAVAGNYSQYLPFEGLAIDPATVRSLEHGLRVCPVVRYLDSYGDLDDGSEGVVEPMLPAQRQLNQSTFGLRMGELYAAFRQRWVTGMAIPEDADGNAVEPWNAAVNRVWQSDSPDTRFGDFAQTDLGGYLDSRDKTLLYVASARQIPPHSLVVGNAVSNVSAEALAALEAGHQQDIAEHKISFGESNEQLLRLCGRAMGDEATWEDISAQVVWRDTTPRSLAQIADALGKLATQLEIPPRELWEKIPGVTQQDIERWEAGAEERTGMADVAALLAAPPPGTDAGEAVDDGDPGGAAADAGSSAASAAAG